MVRRVSPHRQSSAGSSFSRSSFVHGRLGFRLGCLPSGRPSVRLVVSELFILLDQPPGTPCGPLRSSGLFTASPGLCGVSVCRQLHRSFLSTQAGRHTLFDPQCRGSVYPPALRSSPHPPGSPVHSVVSQCDGRLSESQVSGPWVGVDLMSSSFSRNSSGSGLRRSTCLRQRRPLVSQCTFQTP